jgi:hypothetical protein
MRQHISGGEDGASDGADDPQTDADRMHDAICDDLSGRNAR